MRKGNTTVRNECFLSGARWSKCIEEKVPHNIERGYRIACSGCVSPTWGCRATLLECVKFEALILRRSRDLRLGLKMVCCY